MGPLENVTTLDPAGRIYAWKGLECRLIELGRLTFQGAPPEELQEHTACLFADILFQQVQNEYLTTEDMVETAEDILESCKRYQTIRTKAKETP